MMDLHEYNDHAPIVTTLDEARNAIRFCDSYSRLPTLIDLHPEVGFSDLWDRDWLTLLGEMWSICDNIGRFSRELGIVLPTTGPVPELMEEEERAAHAALPDHLTIYRGADRGVNVRGWSWSLDRSIAEKFPLVLCRYYAKNPVLVTATVKRTRILAVKLDRDEQEVIVNPKGLRLTVEPLPRPQEMAA